MIIWNPDIKEAIRQKQQPYLSYLQKKTAEAKEINTEKEISKKDGEGGSEKLMGWVTKCPREFYSWQIAMCLQNYEALE